jgi:hypothetical protein
MWRDTYYTIVPGGDMSNADFMSAVMPDNLTIDERNQWDKARQSLENDEGWADPQMWEPLRHLAGKTLYVQPGHYLCLGDNSPESSDGRSWGLVPSRLLLGRALLVYFPIYNPLPFIGAPVNRFGPIR